MEKYVTREKIKKSIEKNIEELSKELIEDIFKESKVDYILNGLDYRVGEMLVNKLFQIRTKRKLDKYIGEAIEEELNNMEDKINEKIDKLLKPF